MSSASIAVPVRWVASDLPDGRTEIIVYINGNRAFVLVYDPVSKTLTEIDDKNSIHG